MTTVAVTRINSNTVNDHGQFHSNYLIIYIYIIRYKEMTVCTAAILWMECESIDWQETITIVITIAI